MLKLLHISDVHFGAPDFIHDQEIISKSLVETVLKSKSKFDVLIFTGDLAHQGSKEEFFIGQKWLMDINSKSMAPLIVLPGNHDVLQSAASNRLFRHISSNIENYTEARKNDNIPVAHLQNFFEWNKVFLSSNSDIISPEWDNLYGTYFFKDLGYIKVSIISMNSAIFSCNNKDKSNLVIDIKTMREFIARSKQDSADFIIVAAHHPLDFLVPWNREIVTQLLSQQGGAHLFLHGHAHQHRGQSFADNTGVRLTTLGAGASYQSPDWPKSFSFYAFDFKAKQIIPETYIYSPNAGEWTADPGSRRFDATIPQLKRKRFKHAQPQSFNEKTVVNSEINLDSADSESIDIEKYRSASKQIGGLILTTLSTAASLADYIYAFRFRVKSAERIVRKLNEKRSGDAFYSLSDMSDICGLRIVTLYRDQITVVLKEIISMWNNKEFLYPNSVPEKGISVVINQSQFEADHSTFPDTVERVCANFSNNIRVSQRVRATGYSSVHLVGYFAVPSNTIDKMKELKIEIQVRSSLEDVWGEIDHRLRYGTARGAVGVLWGKPLSVFKGHIDSLVSFVDIIREQSLIHPVTARRNLQRSRTVSSPSSQLAKLKHLPREIFSRVEAAYDLWKAADAGRTEVGGNPGSYRRAADAFIDITVEFKLYRELTSDNLEELTYIAKIEAAYLYALTGDSRDDDRSIALYLDILSTRPFNATALYRLAVLHHLREMYPSALQSAQNAIEAIEGNRDPEVDKSHWLYDSARRTVGNTYWRIAIYSNVSRADKAVYLNKALMIAYEVVKSPARSYQLDRIEAVNDLVYYYWEIDRLGFKLDTQSILQLIPIFINELRDYVISSEYPQSHFLDTLVRVTRNKRSDAIQFALALEESLERSVLNRDPKLELEARGSISWMISLSQRLNHDEADSLKLCEEVLASYGRN